jgi:hypothetical protein
MTQARNIVQKTDNLLKPFDEKVKIEIAKLLKSTELFDPEILLEFYKKKVLLEKQNLSPSTLKSYLNIIKNLEKDLVDDGLDSVLHAYLDFITDFLTRTREGSERLIYSTFLIARHKSHIRNYTFEEYFTSINMYVFLSLFTLNYYLEIIKEKSLGKNKVLEIFILTTQSPEELSSDQSYGNIGGTMNNIIQTYSDEYKKLVNENIYYINLERCILITDISGKNIKYNQLLDLTDLEKEFCFHKQNTEGNCRYCHLTHNNCHKNRIDFIENSHNRFSEPKGQSKPDLGNRDCSFYYLVNENMKEEIRDLIAFGITDSSLLKPQTHWEIAFTTNLSKISSSLTLNIWDKSDLLTNENSSNFKFIGFSGLSFKQIVDLIRKHKDSNLLADLWGV